MRKTQPIRYDASRDCWDVFRYGDVKEVLADSDNFSASTENTTPSTDGSSLLNKTMMFSDGSRHAFLRRSIDDKFGMEIADEVESELQRIIPDLLRQCDDNNHIELVDQFSYPLSSFVISLIIGVPEADRDEFVSMSEWVLKSNKIRQNPNRAETGQTNLLTYLKKMIENNNSTYRLRNKSADNTRSEQCRSVSDHLGLCIMIMIAGNVARYGITNTLYNVIHNEHGSKLLNGDIAVKPFVEESLRFRSPTQAMSRVVSSQIELGDQQISEGDIVVAWISSANRDETVFNTPSIFNPLRENNSHIAFGYGTHYCLGANIARRQIQVAIEEFVRYVDSASILDQKLSPVQIPFIQSVESLPAHITSRDH